MGGLVQVRLSEAHSATQVGISIGLLAWAALVFNYIYTSKKQSLCPMLSRPLSSASILAPECAEAGDANLSYWPTGSGEQPSSLPAARLTVHSARNRP